MVALVWMFLVCEQIRIQLENEIKFTPFNFSYSIASCFWATVGLGESLQIWQEWPRSCVCVCVWKFCLRRQQEIKRAHSSWPSFNLPEESCLAKIFIPQKVLFSLSYCWARFRHCSVHFKVITAFQGGNSASHNCNFHSIQVLKKTFILGSKEFVHFGVVFFPTFLFCFSFTWRQEQTITCSCSCDSFRIDFNAAQMPFIRTHTHIFYYISKSKSLSKVTMNSHLMHFSQRAHCIRLTAINARTTKRNEIELLHKISVQFFLPIAVENSFSTFCISSRIYRIKLISVSDFRLTIISHDLDSFGKSKGRNRMQNVRNNFFFACVMLRFPSKEYQCERWKKGRK